jgi:hypothetical protein
MIFSKEKPPIFDRLHKAFGVEWGGSLVIAYNGVIYHSKPLDPSVVVHENVHLARQGKDADGWYSKYIDSPKFRLGEELLAYRAQYQYIKEVIPDRNERAKYLFKFANDLGGKTYGNIITPRDAMRLIDMQ